MRMVSVHKNSISFAPKKTKFFYRINAFIVKKIIKFAKIYIINNEIHIIMYIFAVAPFSGSVD